MAPDLQRLRSSRTEIEKRVQERTAEFAKVNEKLKAEIARHRQVEKEFGLLLTITRSIHEAQGYHSALETALRDVCEATGWSFGEAWVPRADGMALECSPAWYGKGPHLKKFRRLSEGFTFSPGVGLPGRVWLSRRPEWIRDCSVLPEKGFKRVQIAMECGLKASLGLPILVRDEVLAVLVFFMVESLEEDRRATEIVSAVAAQLGSAVEQKRAEEELRGARRVLEERVRGRTAELARANEALRDEIKERTEIAESARESQRVLQTLMSNLPGMAYRCRNDRDWTMEFVSDGCLELTGYQPFEVIENGKITFARLIHPDDQETVWNEVQTALQEHRPFQLVYRIITATGGEKVVWEHGRGIFSSEDRLQALEGFITDITERRRATEALQQERDFAESLVETAQVIILVLDAEGRILRFNPYMEKVSGYSLEEVRGKDWFTTFLPERDQDRIRELFHKVVSHAESRGVNPIATKEGQEREIEWSNTTLKDMSGQVIGVLSVGQDITERRRAETWLRGLIETTQDAVISIDRKGHIVLFNPAAEHIFGYDKAEVVGREIDVLMAEPYASEHESYVARYERTGERKAIGRIRTVAARRKNGEEFPIELSVTELKTDEEIRYAAFIRDISEKAKLQEQLVEKERLAAIGATTAKLAHEIGNPLNGMYLTIQLLQQQLSRYEDTCDDRVISTVTKLENEIIRLNRLLTEFRSLSRHETYRFRPLSLGKALTDVLEIEKPRYAELGIQVEQDLPEDLPVIVADGDRLKQAFLNLCKNAAESMSCGGTLTVKACPSGDGIVLEIIDTGDGIPEGADITHPFFTTKTQGSGIGLLVVRQIVAAHGGSIAYASEPGKGTMCRLTLPLYPVTTNTD